MHEQSKGRPRRGRPPERTRSDGPARTNGANNSRMNAQRQYERYSELAKEAARTGDTVETENFYQHAEHYFRMMRDPEQS